MLKAIRFAARAGLLAQVTSMTIMGGDANATPATFALCSLMFLNAARLPTRLEPSGDLLQLLEQDRSRWDERLLSEGHRLLEASATGSELTGSSSQPV